MTTRISTPLEYRAAFPELEQRKTALHYALEIRKFEIELYWKRTTYFWTLLAATFGGYFALSAAKEQRPTLIFLVSCLGLVLATGWYLVNRGSKYWQSNWERHVDSLEDEFVGPLYKTTISEEEFPWCKLIEGYRYSVSKINQLISLFIVFVWMGLFIAELVRQLPPMFVLDCLIGAVSRFALGIAAIGTVFFLVLLGYYGKSGAQGKPRKITFVINRLE